MARPRAREVEILSGWKEIANYLGKGVRTVQRYERELRLPIRRPAGRESVVATKVELDGWIAASPLREAFRLQQAVVENGEILNEFKRNMREFRTLRQEAAGARTALHESVQLLGATMTLVEEMLASSLEHRVFAEVLTSTSKLHTGHGIDGEPEQRALSIPPSE